MIQRKGAKTQRKSKSFATLRIFALGVLALLIAAWQPADAFTAGTYQSENPAVTLAEDAELIVAEGADQGTAIRTSQAEFLFNGSEVKLRWQGSAQIHPQGRSITVRDLASGDEIWKETSISFGPSFQNDKRVLLIADNAPFILDTITVEDNSTANLLITVWPILGVVAVLGIIFLRYLVRKSNSDVQ